MLMIITTFACGVLVLGMIGLNNTASVVVLGTLYGYFSGMCEYSLSRFTSLCFIIAKDIALMVPLMTVLTSELSELG